MPPRKTARKSAPKPDPLAGLRVEVCASLGESYIKAECPLASAADVLARLHGELTRMGTLRPDALPKADAVAGGYVYTDDETEYESRRLGF